ncbi:MAG: CCA tRNA nucleotidyltransferase [Cellulosilyticaceae bacterium]
MKISYNEKLPKDAIYIIEQLEKAGFEAYIVGGCVRDLLMSRTPHDWDITTSAKPEEVKLIFPRTYDTGIEHGTVTVIVAKEHYEVTTYRIEGEYKDCRHPEAVLFVEDLTQDLSRRDFTMNAIAYHPKRGFVDPYNGMQHILEKKIVSVRNATERFSEDALRILRAVRFHTQIGFDIEAQTAIGIQECKHLLENISKERIREEFIKMMMSDRPEFLSLLNEWGLLKYIMPQYMPAFHTVLKAKYKEKTVAKHSIAALKKSPKDLVVRLSLLLHDLGKASEYNPKPRGVGHVKISSQMAKEILKELRFDNQTINDVYTLISTHDWYSHIDITKIRVKLLMKDIGSELFDKMISLNRNDIMAQDGKKMLEKLEKIKQAENFKQNIIEDGDCYTLKMLAIDGRDLIECGVPKGKEIGEYLLRGLEYVIENPKANQKENILEYLQLETK